MAEFNLDDIRAAVRFRGDYTNERKFPNADVNREIQVSFGEFYALVDKHHQGYWDTVADVVTVAAQGYIALPTGCWKTKLIARVEGDDVEELLQVGPDALVRYGTATGKPVAYRLTSRGADLFYTPNGIYTLRVVYTPRAPLLESATYATLDVGALLSGIVGDIATVLRMKEAGTTTTYVRLVADASVTPFWEYDADTGTATYHFDDTVPHTTADFEQAVADEETLPFEVYTESEDGTGTWDDAAAIENATLAPGALFTGGDSKKREWYNGWEDYVILSTIIKLDDREKKPHGDRDRKLEMIAKRIEEEAGERRQQEPEYLRIREYDGIVDIYGDR